jgi:hypothetical protein
MPNNTQELGDVVHSALSAVGVTPELVSAWLGKPCNCKERQEKLNRLSRWAKRVMYGRTENAKEYLTNITDEG